MVGKREPKSVSRDQPAHSQASGLCSPQTRDPALSSCAHRNGCFGIEDPSSPSSVILLPETLVLWMLAQEGDSESEHERGGRQGREDRRHPMPSSMRLYFARRCLFSKINLNLTPSI